MTWVVSTVVGPHDLLVPQLDMNPRCPFVAAWSFAGRLRIDNPDRVWVIEQRDPPPFEPALPKPPKKYT